MRFWSRRFCVELEAGYKAKPLCLYRILALSFSALRWLEPEGDSELWRSFDMVSEEMRFEEDHKAS
jgi:hypothetical protein